MRELLLVAVGLVCVAGGLVFLPLPTPFGLPLFIVGAALILTGSALARQLVKRLRTNHAGVHFWLAKSERYMPSMLRRMFRKTRPDKRAH